MAFTNASFHLSDYGPTHWLTEYYEVFSRYAGCGFVTCYPTIYIRKAVPVVPQFKRSTLSPRASLLPESNGPSSINRSHNVGRRHSHTPLFNGVFPIL
jgi:hypothetical protein